MDIGEYDKVSLSKDEKRRIRKALDGRISVKKLQTPFEYHYFAWHWNWDEGYKPLEWIARQPNCDKGTALLIYWHAAPTWFCQYQYRKDIMAKGGNIKLYDFLKKIEKKVAKNFYTTQAIRFDPHNDGGYDWTTAYLDKSIKSQIPDYMLHASQGIELERGILTEFICRDLAHDEIVNLNQKIGRGSKVLKEFFPNFNDEVDPDTIVKLIKDYVDLQRKLTGGQVTFDSPQVNVGWVFAEQIRRKYRWTWKIHSWDDGDNEYMGLMSPDNIYVISPTNIVKLSIGRHLWDNAISTFFDLIGAYTKTQDFRDFYARGWINVTPKAKESVDSG